jgi:WD40 repeat protein
MATTGGGAGRDREKVWEDLAMKIPMLLFVGAVLAALVLDPRPLVAEQPVDAAPRTDLYGDPLPAGAIARLGTIRFRHGGWPKGIGFSADGNWVIVASEDHNIYCFEAATGKVVRTIDTGQSIQAFCLSPDHKIAASLGSQRDEAGTLTSHSLKLWDVATGTEKSTSTADSSWGSQIAIAPDGATIVIGREDGTLRICDVAAGAEILSQKISRYGIASLAFSPDGETLAVGSRDRLYLWEWTAGKEPQEIKAAAERPGPVAFSPDGKTLAVGSDFGAPALQLLEVPSGRVIRTFGSLDERHYVRHVSYSPDAKWLASATHDTRAVDLWDAATGKRLRSFDLSPRGATHVAFSPDCRMLAAAEFDNAVQVWDLATGAPAAVEAVGHSGTINQVVFLGGGQTVATSSDDGTVRVWDARTGRQRLRLEHRAGEDTRYKAGLLCWVRTLAASPDGKLLASSSLDDTVRLWDAATGQQIYRLPGHGELGGWRALAFTPEGKRLASWGDDMYLRVWDMGTGKALAEWALRPSGIKIPEETDEPRRGGPDDWRMGLDRAAFSPDGRLLVLRMGSIYVFDVESGKELGKSESEDGHAMGLAVSPDGKSFLTSAWGRGEQTKLPDGRVRYSPAKNDMLRLQEISHGETLWKQTIPHGAAGPVAFSADGALFALGARARPGKIQIWKTANRNEALTLTGFPSAPASLAFSADCRLLVAGMQDGSALVWELPQEVTK